MPMTHRLMPPADGLHPTIMINQRSYTCALGSTIDVPDQDAYVMIANGWTAASSGGVGVTSARPSAVVVGRGASFHDATLGIAIRSDGRVWRNPDTGAAV